MSIGSTSQGRTLRSTSWAATSATASMRPSRTRISATEPRRACRRAGTCGRSTSSSSAAGPSVRPWQSTLVPHADRSERVLALEGGPFLCRSTCRTCRSSGRRRRRATDHQPQKEVWGLAWNAGSPSPTSRTASADGRFWGGWSPRLLDSGLPQSAWPKAVPDDLEPKALPVRPRATSANQHQIGVTETNDFIFGDSHRAMRTQVFNGLAGGNVSEAMTLASLPDHPAVTYRDTPPR